jgi:hypothetical protein
LKCAVLVDRHCSPPICCRIDAELCGSLRMYNIVAPNRLYVLCRVKTGSELARFKAVFRG